MCEVAEPMVAFATLTASKGLAYRGVGLGVLWVAQRGRGAGGAGIGTDGEGGAGPEGGTDSLT